VTEQDTPAANEDAVIPATEIKSSEEMSAEDAAANEQGAEEADLKVVTSNDVGEQTKTKLNPSNAAIREANDPTLKERSEEASEALSDEEQISATYDGEPAQSTPEQTEV
jgi:hypothetical protein